MNCPQNTHKQTKAKDDLEKLQKVKLEYDSLLLKKIQDIKHNSNKISYISAKKLVNN